MTEEIIAQMEKLIDKIEEHRHHYYLENKSIISDPEYDSLERELLDLEKAYPDLVRPYSSSFRVGGAVMDEHVARAHRSPMLSLENAYTQDDLQQFFTRAQKAADGGPLRYAVELKIDGLSLSLVYENGLLARAVTRGDGKTGEDVTLNAKTLKEVPLRVADWQDIAEMEVRGEVYIDQKTFQKLNDERETKGLPLYANPRNVAAGSMRVLDSGKAAERNLRIFIYQVLGPWADNVPSHFERLQSVAKLGFPINPRSQRVQDIEELFELIDGWDKIRSSLGYETDGVVLKVDDSSLYEKMGYTTKFPKWATAYKFSASQATTQIKSVSIQVGRTGVLTPVAELEPVPLAGTTVSRATLHNFDEIAKKDIRVNDWVFIEKGGDIIPKVVSVIRERRTSETVSVEVPDTCPRCGTATLREQDQVAVRCENLSCPAQLERRVSHFAARNAMDIHGLGKERVQQMVAEKIVPDLASLFRLTPKDLWRLERVGDKWIENLLEEIQKSKKKPFAKVLFAVGIPMVGQKAAEVLASTFKSYERLAAASVEEIAAIHSMGEKVAESLTTHLKMESYRDTFKAFQELGLQLEELGPSVGEPPKPAPLAGKTLVVTGSFSQWSRVELTELLKGLGAKVTSSVTKKTDFLVAGEKAGSKLTKAHALNVDVIDEEKVREWLNL